MPASMISAPTGGRPKVIGSSMATVAMVPMPGNTPTKVPTSAPIRHSRRFIGENATPNPRLRFEMISLMARLPQHEARLELERQPQNNREEEAAEGRDGDADDQRLHPLLVRRSKRGDHESRERRNDQAERADGDRKAKDRQGYEEWSAPVVALQGWAVEQ